MAVDAAIETRAGITLLEDLLALLDQFLAPGIIAFMGFWLAK